MIVWGAIEVRRARVFAASDRSPDRSTFAWSLGAVLAALAAALLLDVFVPAVVPQGAQTPLFRCAAALAIAGVLFRLGAIRILGAASSPTR